MEHEEIAGLAGMMMEWIQIGPMLLRLEWLVFFVGGGLGMALSRWLAIKKKLEPAWDLDIIWILSSRRLPWECWFGN